MSRREGHATMRGKADDILATVGRTPVVRINKLAPPGVNLFVKVEAFNPMGSIKDRLALGVIEDAERRGALRPGQTVIEASSGNTGIGLAMVCAVRGYPLVVVMAENFSVERRKLLRFLGAKVVLTPAAQKGSGMLAKATELAQAHGWFLCRQFDNAANADMHSRTTAVEILDAFAGERLDYFVTGSGTGGTLKGVARVLRAQRPDTAVVVCEPDNSPTLGSGIAQPRHADGTADGSHPSFRPHLMQGWSPDFIPRLTQDALDAKLLDRILPIDGNEALRCARELARREGILAGTSGGAALAGALQLCAGAPAGTTVLCMLPDTGERYLSTPLFEHIGLDMSEQELAISRSTPACRFEASPPVAPTRVDAPAPAAFATMASGDASSPEIAAFLDDVLRDPRQPVVLFALSWCEFCWSVRKLFARHGIAHRVIDLDSAANQRHDRGGRIRAALRARTGSATIPQVFVGGEYIGGCTDTFDACRSGALQRRLRESVVAFDASVQGDPYDLLPLWLHPREGAC